MANNQSNDALIALLLIPIGAFLLVAWKISSSLGADFQVTLGALLYSLVIVGVIGAVWWFTRFYIGATVFAACSLVWPKWWTVLDSTAVVGNNFGGIQFEPLDAPWWTSGWFYWGVEVALVACIFYFVYRHFNDF